MTDQLALTRLSIDRFDVFGGMLALLAFIMAFYALLARERKTPYMTSSLYSMSVIFLLVLFFTAMEKFLVSDEDSARKFDLISLLFFLGIISFVLVRIWNIHNRHINFRDDNLFKNLSIVRFIRRKWRMVKGKRRYEENPSDSDDWIGLLDHGIVTNSEKLIEAKVRAKNISWRAVSLSIGFRTNTISSGDKIILSLAELFLKKEYFVQYATCTRHPMEFVAQLRSGWPAPPAWKDIIKHLVIIDAYTPHFAFTDGIHAEASNKIIEDNIKSIISSPTFAGLHTATTKAFNLLKERDDKNVRRPTLIIYDGPHALVDLESSEQYRIFIRHVMPSERQYGGMLTVFVESAIEGPDLDLLKAYVDLFEDRTLLPNTSK